MPVQDLLFEKEPYGEVTSKRAGAHSCLQTWSRYKGVVWRGNPTGWENFSTVESTITRESERR
jgi:hypothetical protein